MTKVKRGSDPKKPTSILPPNDPARPDWGILSDSLGLKAHATPSEGSTPAQAAAQMRTLLFRCLQSDETYEALIFKCAGSTIAGRTKEDSAARANFAEMIAFIKTRLWNRRADGAKTTSRLGREHSSNEIISAWNPEAGGVKKYIQVNVANILNRDWKAANMELSNGRKTSLEVLAAGGKHLDASGRIFEAGQSGADDSGDAPEFVERDESFERESASFSAARRSREQGEGEGEAEPEGLANAEGLGREELPDTDEPEVAAVTEQRREFDVALIASRSAGHKSAVLRSPEHPDYRVLAAALVDDVPEPELDLAGREQQLREMALKSFDLHCADLTDFAETREAVAEWKPSEVSFARYFPDAAQQIGESLNVADRQKIRDDPLQLEFAADFFILSGEIKRQSQQLKPRPAGMSAIEWEEICHNAKEWFNRMSDSAEDLVSPERPDYIALCHLTNRKIERAITPEEMAEKLKIMYAEWTEDRFYSPQKLDSYDVNAAIALSENRQGLFDLNRRMEQWNPLTDGYAGEVMATHLRDIRLEQEQREQAARIEEATHRADVEARLARGSGSEPAPVRPASIPAEEYSAENSLFPDLAFAPKPADPGPARKPLSTPAGSAGPERSL
jgi:hypothetical protein